jgi:hypothetical protein
MDTITKAAVRNLVESPARASKGSPVYAKQLAAGLAGARALGSDAYAYGIELALASRKETLRRDTLWQRKWGANVSKRPGRGNHHDSWATREGYIRCSGDYRDYMEYAYTRLADHPNWQFGSAPRQWRRKDAI